MDEPLMNSLILRHFWSLIEEIQPATLLEISDTELIQQLLKQLECKKILSEEEITNVSAYISSRLPLIRDLAELPL
jgi:hypothetical protein